tara:strand:- start:627 stop:1484 length:858 start_codon:yes stop_codon:yes gene_type:complete
MHYTKQPIKELYFEYLTLRVKNKSSLANFFSFFKYLISPRRIQKSKRSLELTEKIRSFDDTDYKNIYMHSHETISAISSQWINTPSDDQRAEIDKLFTQNKRKEGKTSQNIIHYEKWKDNLTLNSYFAMCIDEIKKNTMDIKNFKLQNAYFVNDEFGFETYAHKFHHDDVGLRMKAWFVIDAMGEIGIEYQDLPYSDIKERRYGIPFDIYALRNKDLNKNPTKKLYAKKGVSYLLNTDIFHRGFMKPESRRLAFVIEFINFNKMKEIDGLSDACHFNEQVAALEL